MKKFFLLAFAAGMMTACDTDDQCNLTPGTDPAAPDNAIGISGILADISPQSRTTITGSTAAWANGDQIGVFCPQAKGTTTANDRFVLSGVGTTPVWTPDATMYWLDGTTSHKFVAYAPYASGSNTSTAIPLPSLATQTGTISPAQDFLYSKNQWATGVTRSGTPVPLIFTHALTLIQFDITINNSVATGTTLTSFVLASATSGDKLYTSDSTSSTINLTSGSITAGTTTNTATITPATAPTLSSTATSEYVLILPGTMTTAPSLAITLTESGSTLNVPPASLVTTTFAAGSKYTYNVVISRQAITISTPTITDWTSVSGGTLNPGI